MDMNGKISQETEEIQYRLLEIASGACQHLYEEFDEKAIQLAFDDFYLMITDHL